MSKIFIYDEFNPEDNAMLQALYSRSASSVEEHVDRVRSSGSGKFMERFYVGYGHSSIADCGSTTIFIEGISILADKAIQDWPLYSGQETSTRYIDMSKQDIIDPIDNDVSKQILNDWMEFYTNNGEEVKEYIKSSYPRGPEENKNLYEKAIAARSFDILRGFLPAGITTQLSWHTNLRQAWDKLALLRYHPLVETREIAKNILNELRAKYPHSFCHKEYEKQEAYWKQSTVGYTYHNSVAPKDGYQFSTDIKTEDLESYRELLETRPEKTNLPLFLADLGLNKFNFLLDFGSFRDLQRHRNGSCRMPLLTTEYGFNKWYLNQLPSNLQEQAKALIAKQVDKIKNLDVSPEKKQYYVPLGFNVNVKISYGLPASIYVTELRTGKLVHPSLRKVAHLMHNSLATNFPILKLHSDLEQDDWDIRRGGQDIIEKTNE